MNIIVRVILVSLSLGMQLPAWSQDFSGIIETEQIRAILVDKAKDLNTKVWLTTTKHGDPALNGLLKEYLEKRATGEVQFSKSAPIVDQSVKDRAYLVNVARAVDPRTITAIDPDLTPLKLRWIATLATRIDPALIDRLKKALPVSLSVLGHNDDYTKLYMPGFGNDSAPPNAYPGPPPTFAPMRGGRVDAQFYRQGFREVAVLALGNQVYCTATLVGHGWLLTAAHCIGSYVGEGNAAHFATLPTAMISLSVVFPDESGSDCLSESPNGDVTAPTHCQFLKHRLISAPVVSDVYADDVRGDIALLKIDPIATQNRTPASVKFGAPPPDHQITVAGYGKRSVERELPWKLEVGWQTLEQTQRDPMVVTSTTQLPTSPCAGDSGGPIFAGTNYGIREEHHLLIAVVSKGSLADSSKCTPGNAYYPWLSDQPVKDWLCQKLENSLTGCAVPQQASN
jgi:hypothetical protein